MSENAEDTSLNGRTGGVHVLQGRDAATAHTGLVVTFGNMSAQPVSIGAGLVGLLRLAHAGDVRALVEDVQPFLATRKVVKPKVFELELTVQGFDFTPLFA